MILSRETSGPDQMKNVTSNDVFLMVERFFEIYVKKFSPEKNGEYLKNATHAVNLFAGHANESEYFLDYLSRIHNSTCLVTAVDKHPLPAGYESSFQTAVDQHRFEFVTADVQDYLESVPNSSLDLVTAFGAEYVFRDLEDGDEQVKKIFTLIAQKLKVGGMFLCLPLFDGSSPSLSIPDIVNEAGLETIGNLTFYFRKRLLQQS